METVLTDSKIWNSISFIIKKEHNDLSTFVLDAINYVILHRFSVTLCKYDNDNRTLFNRVNGKIYIQIKRYDNPITDYDRVIQREDEFYYIQKIVEQSDSTKQYLQIKVHKDFFKIFCY